jgi:large subunit ribosomal protein L19
MTATQSAVQNPITPVRVDERRAIDIHPGDTVRVWQKMQDEKGKTRLQAFEGLVLARKHGSEAGATFTVRRMIDGVGVEKIFPLYSPMIDKIEITKRATVRRSKLYYIRDKAASQIRRQMRRMSQVDIATSSESAAPAASETEENSSVAEEKVVTTPAVEAVTEDQSSSSEADNQSA